MSRRAKGAVAGLALTLLTGVAGWTAKIEWPTESHIIAAGWSNPAIRDSAVTLLVGIGLLAVALLVLKIWFVFIAARSYKNMAAMTEDAGRKMIEKAETSNDLRLAFTALSQHMTSLRAAERTEEPDSPDEDSSDGA